MLKLVKYEFRKSLTALMTLLGLTAGLEGCRFALEPYGEIHLPLVGTYQPYNALLAVTAVEATLEEDSTVWPS